MQRNRMLLQLDDELVITKRSLARWREEKTLLADIPLRDCAARMVTLREVEIHKLIEVQESLLDIRLANVRFPPIAVTSVSKPWTRKCLGQLGLFNPESRD